MLRRVLDGEFDQYTEDDLNEALLRTACHGYVECLLTLLVHGGNPDCEDLDGDTPLMLAASNNHVGSFAHQLLRLFIGCWCHSLAASARRLCSFHLCLFVCLLT